MLKYSMSDFSGDLDKEKRLKEKMAALGIGEADITESFIRAKGPGGQNVNKAGLENPAYLRFCNNIFSVY